MGRMKVSTIANLTGILAGARAEEGHLGIFGDRLKTMRVHVNRPVLEQLDKAEKLAQRIGQATENGIWLFWDQAIRERQHWDSVFVFSDMQAGHGGLYGTDKKAYAAYRWGGKNGAYIDVAKLVATYRQKVNPEVDVFLVQVAGYQDTIIPEIYGPHVYFGWLE